MSALSFELANQTPLKTVFLIRLPLKYLTKYCSDDNCILLVQTYIVKKKLKSKKSTIISIIAFSVLRQQLLMRFESRIRSHRSKFDDAAICDIKSPQIHSQMKSMAILVTCSLRLKIRQMLNYLQTAGSHLTPQTKHCMSY